MLLMDRNENMVNFRDKYMKYFWKCALFVVLIQVP